MNLARRAIGILVVGLLLLLSACQSDLTTKTPAVADIETQAQTCTLSWPIVNTSRGTTTSVKQVQYLLRSRGYSLTVDGSFGTITENAVKHFQDSVGLDRDGSVGPKTWPKLIRVVQYESQGDAVRAVQLRLGITRDGSFGPQTLSAVKAFQNQNGLESDGVVGPNTWTELVGGTASCSPVNPSTRAQLAQQILNNSRITLTTGSSPRGGDSVRQNIIDTANGLYAKSGCNYYYGNCSSTVNLHTALLQAMLDMANAGNSYTVTSLAGHKHSNGSYHYQGKGIDIGTWNGTHLGSPNSAHKAARSACIAEGSRSSETYNAYYDPYGGHHNHVHCAFY
jgi:peptidoglycan hydrolase-like protein with peptidoglycan-binding domain